MESDPSTAIAVITMIMTIFTAVFSAWREKRNRKWDAEDRVRREQEIAEQTRKLITHTDELAKGINQNVDKNTEVSREAFKTANGFNEKILSLKQEILDARKSGIISRERQAELAELLVQMAAYQAQQLTSDSEIKRRLSSPTTILPHSEDDDPPSATPLPIG